MVKKKGKKGKKKGKKKQKKVKEYDPPKYELPEYEDPDIVTPKVELTIKLANPVNEVLTLKLSDIPITTRVEYIRQKIAAMHQGAVSEIMICRDRFNPEEAFDPTKTLEKCGIISEGEVKLFYDFKPVTNPLLV
ncbi:hypothetical protein TTHERM_00997710 (macronuclear) [Tetrahymena thermophila SB210]|uniref:Ubiquitin-like domain-containing protein n=1 Tax=Tetrahymena thermophila (strain SB210) TaxID=312017 RepID=Q23QZ0_TETTS|nr:hypothetical protein TTHERM_00997710 [Tetrahymena thermophila SB210]EAR98966.1 hypothetical protein TTHERM_00997710 [Tetrahymena thermophila SB210]|eukprot:XP_001019211.1 hypothetical protein TTHERM_00997710 [Tetrahymena thermophila SB210]